MAFPQLRPLSFGEILDGAFSLYRRNFSAFFLAALLPMLPVLGAGLLVAMTVDGVGAGDPRAALAAASLLLSGIGLLGLLAQVLQWGALTYLVSRAYMGTPATTGEGLRRGMRCYLSLVVACFIAGVLMGIGLLFLVVPMLLLACMFFAVAPAVVVEGHGPVEGLSRSRELASGAWGRIFLLITVAFIIAALPSWGLSAVSRVSSGMPAAEMMIRHTGVYVLLQIVNILLSTLTLPFVVGSIVLLYYDRRVRAEALDVELATQHLAAAAT